MTRLLNVSILLSILGLAAGCESTGHVPSDAEVRQAAPGSYRDPLQGNFGNDPFWQRAPGEFAPPAGFQKEYEQERAKRIALEKQLAAQKAKKPAAAKPSQKPAPKPSAASKPVQ
jgi:hypothetical protein